MFAGETPKNHCSIRTIIFVEVRDENPRAMLNFTYITKRNAFGVRVTRNASARAIGRSRGSTGLGLQELLELQGRSENSENLVSERL